MTPAEHYRIAEQMLVSAEEAYNQESYDNYVKRAHVHAILATVEPERNRLVQARKDAGVA